MPSEAQILLILILSCHSGSGEITPLDHWEDYYTEDITREQTNADNITATRKDNAYKPTKCRWETGRNEKKRKVFNKRISCPTIFVLFAFFVCFYLWFVFSLLLLCM